MKILLAVDGSKYTKKMLAYLTTHSGLFGAQHDYTVFTAAWPLPPRVQSAVGADVAYTYHLDEARKVLDPVCKFLLRHDINAKSSSKAGPAGKVISKSFTAKIAKGLTCEMSGKKLLST